ncbi:MAG: hypothetical protein ACI9CF_000383 [Candidatus Omnitrophota bacterium]|jgi:hypothetical protein
MSKSLVALYKGANPTFIAISLFMATFILRLAFGLKFAFEPYFDFTISIPGSDQNFFFSWATAIRNGSWVWAEQSAKAAFQIAPLYAGLMSASLQISKYPFALLIILQSLLSSSLIFFFIGLAKKLKLKYVGLVSALVWVFYGPSYFYDACMIRASLLTSLGFMIVFFLYHYLELPNLRRLILLGVSLGVLFAIRPSPLLVACPLILCALSLKKKSFKLCLGSIGLICIILITVSPITARNWMASQTWVPVSAQGADALILGNDATGPGVSFVPTQQSSRLKRESKDSSLIAMRLIMRELKQSPIEYLKLYLRKSRMLLNGYEIPANYSFYLFQRFFPLSKLCFLSYWLLLPFAGLGVYVLIKTKSSGPFLICFLSLACGMLVIHIQSRYRFPLAPYLVFLSSAAVIKCCDLLRSRRTIAALLIIGYIACVLLLTRPLPSYGYNFATKGNGVTELNQESIREVDYLTALLAYFVVGQNKYAEEINKLSIDAYAAYGTHFLTEFKSKTSDFSNYFLKK